jgi:hypothetical protein
MVELLLCETEAGAKAAPMVGSNRRNAVWTFIVISTIKLTIKKISFGSDDLL